MGIIASLQFGNCYQRRAPGFVLLSQVYKNPCYLWMTLVNDCASLQVEDPLLEGYVQSSRPAEFWIGLSDDGIYRLTMTCYEPLKDHGPFTIRVNGAEVLSNVVLNAGSIRTEPFQAQSKDGIIRMEFIPSSGKDFIINALVVEGTDDGVVPQSVFKSAPPVTLPNKEELIRRAGDTDPVGALRRVCDWLIEHCRTDGFIGDTWTAGSDCWYTASMPIRALLSGYDILNDSRCLKAALGVLDLFVGEQLPNGAFEGIFRGRPTAELSEPELNRSLKTRLPMSDVGSVVSALAVGSHYADGSRKERYVQAVRHFCDDWAMRFQQPSGAFTDGQWPGVDGIYSCATAIEAATFSLAYAITGNNRYLKVAADAIRFLLPDWRKDGRMTGRAPHWVVRSRQPFVMETLYFGDQWYYDEGFITTGRYVQDDDFRRKINEALGWRVFGSQGLLNALEGKVWWPIQDIWNNAKSVGMVQTLLHTKLYGMTTPVLEEFLSNMQRFLCTPEYSRQLGVMADDTERPVSICGYQTWGGMRMEATGFAGMTLAEMIKPGVIYLVT